MTAPTLDTARRERVFAPIYARGDRILTRVVLAHLVLAFTLAGIYETWFVSALVAPLAAAIFLVPRFLVPGTFLTRASAGIALQTYCALHIYQLHGLAEMHFWFFTSTTLMILYQDPKALWPGVLLIILQHILFALLHNSGLQLYFFEEAYVGATKLGFHFGIALVQVAIATGLASFLRERTLEEEALRGELETARDDAQQALETRSMFLANMSHEIRTPMNGVEGMAEVLLTTELEQDQKESVETILESSRSLLVILNEILDFSRMESGKLQLDAVPFRPAAIGEDVVRLLSPQARSRGVALVCEVQGHPDAAFLGDNARVRQVLVNLVGNGIKFTAEGEVRVTVIVGERAQRGCAEGFTFEVRDTGIGIAADQQERIFQAFEQADGSTHRRFGGTGLGLAITKRMVEAMGGSIELESEQGRGSIFRVHLPLPESAVAEPQAALPAVGRVRSLHRILLVDDQPVNRRVAGRILEQAGHRVVSACDGLEALRFLAEQPFDLVLMDCHMPELDGYGAARHWRQEERRRGLVRTPILALTADAIGGQRDRCLEAGMDEIYTKPISRDRLLEAVDRWALAPADANQPIAG